MTEPGTPPGPEGVETPHDEQPVDMAAQLADFRTQVISEVNQAVSRRLGRFDIAEEVKTALGSINGASTEKAGEAAKDVQANPEVVALQKKLEAQDAELNRERQSTAIRNALASKGLTGTALEDATEALTRRGDIISELDSTGRRIWSGSTQTEFGPVTKPLDDVVGGFLSDRPHYVPAAHRGGAGAQGGTTGPGAGTPKTLQTMTPEEVAGLSDEDLDRAWSGIGGQEAGKQKGLYGDVNLPPTS